MGVSFKKGDFVRFKEEAVKKCAYNGDSETILDIAQVPMKVSYVSSLGLIFTEELRSLPLDPSTIEKI